MRNLVSNLSVELPSLLLACGAIGLVVFYLGITDVQRRIGRDWKRVLARSLLLFVYGVFLCLCRLFYSLWREHVAATRIRPGPCKPFRSLRAAAGPSRPIVLDRI